MSGAIRRRAGSIPGAVALLSSCHPTSTAACSPSTFQSLSQHLSELVPAPKAAELAHKLLILTALSVLIESKRFSIFNRN